MSAWETPAGGEAGGGGGGGGGQQRGAAREWLEGCCRHLAVRTLVLTGLAREDLCGELEDLPGHLWYGFSSTDIPEAAPALCLLLCSLQELR